MKKNKREFTNMSIDNDLYWRMREEMAKKKIKRFNKYIEYLVRNQRK